MKMIRNLFLLAALFTANFLQAQYLETFNTPNKGYLLNFADDFTGVNWSMSPWPVDIINVPGRDDGDYFNTTAAGVLEGIDFDQEVCWISPLINTTAAGTVSLHVDLTWSGFDTDAQGGGCQGDYIRVYYSVNGGAYTMVPNQVGGDACATVAYPSDAVGAPFTDAGTVNQTGITGGSTLQIKVCGSMNSNSEKITIDNVSVPESGVSVGCAAPVLSTALTPVGCSGPNTGAIDLSVSAGNPPYTYDWSNDGPENPDNDSQDLSGLALGTYTVTVSDAASCSATISATIVSDPAITLSSQTLDATCPGSMDGEIDLIVGGGFAPYTFDWSNDGPESPDNDPEDLLGLNPGTYTVTVTDAANCTKTLAVGINTMSGAAYNEQFNLPNKGYLLNFVDDFSAVNWTMSPWSQDQNGGTGRETDDFFSTAGGKLSAMDLDQEVCWQSPVIDMSGGTQFSVDLTWAGFDDADYINVNYSLDGGSFIQVPNAVGGGAGTIQYAPPSSNMSGGTTLVKSGLSGGTLQIQVCASMNSNNETITIDNVNVPGSGGTYCPGPDVTLTPTNVTCNGLNDGAINNTVSGSAPFTYLWSNNATTQNISGLAPGTYTVTVTDANMLSTTASALINEPAVLSLSATQVNPSNCGTTDGSIDLTVTGGNSGYTYDWSNDGAESPDNDPQDLTNLTTGTYTVTVTDAKGCSATLSRTLTYTDNVPPTITCPPDVTLVADGNCSHTLGSYAPASLSDNCNMAPTVMQSPASSTVLTGHNSSQTVTLTADDGNGNTASCTLTVTLKDQTPPTITCPPDVTLAADDNCSHALGSYTPASLSDNCTAAPTTTQSPASSTELTGHNSSLVVTLTADDSHGNTASCTLTVTLQDQTPPTITCPLDVTLAADGNCSHTLGDYIAATLDDNCNIVPTVTQSPASSTVLSGDNSSQVVTLTADDGNGNTASCTLTVTLQDEAWPIITCPPNTTLSADGNCSHTLGSYMPASLSDNCNAAPAVTQSPSPFMILSGDNSSQVVTLTADDGNGNTSSCTFTVTLQDQTPPTIVCPPNTTLAADAFCTQILGNYMPVSVSDNCIVTPTVTQSPSPFTILSGDNSSQVVTLTADDTHGNTASCTLTVTLQDQMPPGITCPPNTTIVADANCSGTIGSYTPVTLSDNCNAAPAVTQSPASSTVLSGDNSSQVVTLTADDGHGNTASCTLTVTLQDQVPPTITCPSNTTIAADANCSHTLGTIAPLSLSDNCTAAPTVTQSPSPSTVLSGDNSTQLVTLTADDGHGNTSSCMLIVTLQDQTPPSITCPSNTTLAADANCSHTIGSYTPVTLSDNCSAAPLVTQSPVSSTVLSGDNSSQVVTLTADDGNGNTSSCMLTVTLQDQTPPSISCPANITVIADANCSTTFGTFTPASLADNCTASPGGVQNPPSGFVLSGSNSVQIVTLTATDNAGNTNTCTFSVTLSDQTPPTLVCKNYTAFLNAAGNVSITSGDVIQSAADNCGTVNIVSVSPNTFTCSDLGAHAVTVSANDGHGNTASCTSTVTVVDAIPPTMLCKPVTLALDGNGNAVLSPSQVNNGSFDNCTLVNIGVSPSSFTCAQVGANTVELGGADQSGNKASCSATVTVIDNIIPTALCKNLSVALPSSGMLELNPSQINNGSHDNCSFTLSAIPGTLTCLNVGANTVVLQATDASGNTATCTAIVTVTDNTAPNALCQDATIYLDDQGHATLNVSDVDDGSYDACGIVSEILSKTEFNCSELLGSPWAIHLTLTDSNRNTSSCISYVSVRDTIPPDAVCQNTTVHLGQNGKAVVYPAALASGSTDNCSVWSFSPVAKVYTSLNLGDNDLYITVRDWSGNIATCLSVVTVLPFNGNNNQDFVDGGGNDAGETFTPGVFDLKVFPNPTSGDVSVAFELSEEQDFSLRITDLSGRLVYWQKGAGAKGENGFALNLQGLIPGLYVVDFQSGTFREQQKLVVQQ